MRLTTGVLGLLLTRIAWRVLIVHPLHQAQMRAQPAIFRRLSSRYEQADLRTACNPFPKYDLCMGFGIPLRWKQRVPLVLHPNRHGLHFWLHSHLGSSEVEHAYVWIWKRQLPRQSRWVLSPVVPLFVHRDGHENFDGHDSDAFGGTVVSDIGLFARTFQRNFFLYAFSLSNYFYLGEIYPTKLFVLFFLRWDFQNLFSPNRNHRSSNC